jgi:hypothetical protein
LNLTTLMATSAQAITFNFEWLGDAGFSASGSFSYDETTAPAIFSESGEGPTNVLDSLTVSFFDPSNSLLATFDNVVDGVSTYGFLGFNFDTTTQELFGSFDIGEDTLTGTPGEFYLFGTVGSGLTLFDAGNGTALDSNSGTITVAPVPEPSSLIGLGLIGLGALAAKRKARS